MSIAERTKEGLAAARAKGRRPGRPKGVFGTSKLTGREAEIQSLLAKTVSKASIAKIMGVSRSTALLTVLKKWTFDLSMPRVASRWHLFEANVNGFPLILHVHGAKPLDDRAEQTLV